jgi:hypothetical protein
MCIFLLATCSGLALPGFAQTPPAAVPQQDPERPLPRVERITHEDKLSRIEELRVGGQTQSIEVQPKNGAPAYNIAPLRNTDASGGGPNQRSGNAGKSSWRVLNF